RHALRRGHRDRGAARPVRDDLISATISSAFDASCRTSRATSTRASHRGSEAPRRHARAVLDGGMSTIGRHTTLGCANLDTAEATVGCTTRPRAIWMTRSLKSRMVTRSLAIGRPLGGVSGLDAVWLSF